MSDSADNSDRADDVIGDDHNSEVEENSDNDRPNRGVAASPRGRKRARKPEKWKQNIRQKQRNLGQAYYSQMAKKNVAARKIGPACRDGCFDKVTRPVIEALFKEY